MRKSEYKRMRLELETEEKGLAKALENVRKKREALDLVWNEVVNKSNEIFEAESAVLEANGVNGHAQKKLIDDATHEFSTNPFAVIDVEAAIKKKYPSVTVHRSTIAGRLKKMAVAGELQVLVAGRGRRPGSFKRKVA